MVIKLNNSYATSANGRDTRAESIDSVGSTLNVDGPPKQRSYKDPSYFDILESIVKLNSPCCPKVRTLLDAYNGHLIDMGRHLLGSLRDAAPEQLAARVGDFNENLFYEMQGHNKDVGSIILDNNDSDGAFSQQLKKDIEIFEASLRESLHHDNLTYRGSYMRTEHTIYQPAHVDYDYPVLNDYGNKLFLAFFPLTDEGAFLQLWDKPKENDNSTIVNGTVVHIPLGKMLVVPADTIHGGGFKRGSTGNLRFHLYIEIHDEIDEEEKVADDLLLHPMNKYTEENDRSRELCERFVDAEGLENLIGVFFDD